MFALSRRFGALADRYGPRLFMGAGPLSRRPGILLLLRAGSRRRYLTDLLPALLVFALGLSITVAPLTATVLADADESDAGIASAINNAIARVAGLIGHGPRRAAIASSFASSMDPSSALVGVGENLRDQWSDRERQPEGEHEERGSTSVTYVSPTRRRSSRIPTGADRAPRP